MFFAFADFDYKEVKSFLSIFCLAVPFFKNTNKTRCLSQFVCVVFYMMLHGISVVENMLTGTDKFTYSLFVSYPCIRKILYETVPKRDKKVSIQMLFLPGKTANKCCLQSLEKNSSVDSRYLLSTVFKVSEAGGVVFTFLLLCQELSLGVCIFDNRNFLSLGCHNDKLMFQTTFTWLGVEVYLYYWDFCFMCCPLVCSIVDTGILLSCRRVAGHCSEFWGVELPALFHSRNVILLFSSSSFSFYEHLCKAQHDTWRSLS